MHVINATMLDRVKFAYLVSTLIHHTAWTFSLAATVALVGPALALGLFITALTIRLVVVALYAYYRDLRETHARYALLLTMVCNVTAAALLIAASWVEEAGVIPVAMLVLSTGDPSALLSVFVAGVTSHTDCAFVHNNTQMLRTIGVVVGMFAFGCAILLEAIGAVSITVGSLVGIVPLAMLHVDPSGAPDYGRPCEAPQPATCMSRITLAQRQLPMSKFAVVDCHLVVPLILEMVSTSTMATATATALYHAFASWGRAVSAWQENITMLVLTIGAVIFSVSRFMVFTVPVDTSMSRASKIPPGVARAISVRIVAFIIALLVCIAAACVVDAAEAPAFGTGRMIVSVLVLMVAIQIDQMAIQVLQCVNRHVRATNTDAVLMSMHAAYRMTVFSVSYLVAWHWCAMFSVSPYVFSLLPATGLLSLVPFAK